MRAWVAQSRINYANEVNFAEPFNVSFMFYAWRTVRYVLCPIYATKDNNHNKVKWIAGTGINDNLCLSGETIKQKH